MFRRSLPRAARGKAEAQPWMGRQIHPVGPKLVGGQAKVRPGYTHFCNQRPQRPLRAIGFSTPLPPVLYNRADQLMQIENALAVQRAERQVSVTLSQLAVGIRNAEEYIEEHLFDREVRPSIHLIWFHEREGLRRHTHVVQALAAHHLVPLFSLISYDFEKGRMTLHETKELYEDLVDAAVAQPRIVQREIANHMVRVYCLEEDHDSALEVVAEMQRRGVRRTFVTYAPLFRMVRRTEDAERHLELLAFIHKVEGGAAMKLLMIDIPRWFYFFGVAIRYHWLLINCIFTSLATWATLHYMNYGTEVW